MTVGPEAVRPLRADRWVLALVLGVGLVARLSTLLIRAHRGDIGGGYDASVYYTASAALLHGRMPYDGDFVLLHPPVIVLAGLPFALLGHLTSDQVGYAAANVAFASVGALASALVAAVVLRHGHSRFAALTAGGFFAVWSVTVEAGAGFRLEPLGDALLGTALLLLARRAPSRRELVLGGIVLGLLLDVKLWWIVPVAVVVLWTGVRARRWSALVVPVAVAAAVAALVLAPFALAGHRMYSALVTDQLGRGAVQGRPTGGYGRFPSVARLADMTGASSVGGRFLTDAEVFTSRWVHLLAVAICLLLLGTALVAVRTALGRLATVLLAVQAAVLLGGPFFFAHYADFAATAAALVVGAAAGVVTGSRARRVHRVARPVLVAWPALAVLSLVATSTTSAPAGVRTDRGLLADRVRDVRCLVSDSPHRLIQADALDRTLANGCPDLVDVQGVGHGGGPDPDAEIARGRANAAWRRTMAAYLSSGDAVLLSDPTIKALLGPAAYAGLTRGQLLVRTGPVQVHAVSHPAR